MILQKIADQWPLQAAKRPHCTPWCSEPFCAGEASLTFFNFLMRHSASSPSLFGKNFCSSRQHDN